MTTEKARKAADILYEIDLLDNDLHVLKQKHSECHESESPLKLASVPVSPDLFCKFIHLTMTEKATEIARLEVELEDL